jgi:hypothetical protein
MHPTPCPIQGPIGTLPPSRCGNRWTRLLLGWFAKDVRPGVRRSRGPKMLARRTPGACTTEPIGPCGAAICRSPGRFRTLHLFDDVVDRPCARFGGPKRRRSQPKVPRLGPSSGQRSGWVKIEICSGSAAGDRRADGRSLCQLTAPSPISPWQQRAHLHWGATCPRRIRMRSVSDHWSVGATRHQPRRFRVMSGTAHRGACCHSWRQSHGPQTQRL